MGNKNSKTKTNKDIDDEKLLKIGLGVGKGQERLEGNFQIGWVRRTNKKYSAPKNDEDHPLLRPSVACPQDVPKDTDIVDDN